MEIIIRRRDIYLVAVVLSLFLSWVAYATYENVDARATLKEYAEAHIDEWFETEPEDTRREDYEYMAIVDMERPYELFGPTFGVVHVYVREEGDEECKTFEGIEYYYRMEADGWFLEHSAGCAAKEHHIRAFQHYLAEGAGVKDSVFDEALGINFDVAQAQAYLDARKEGRNPFLAVHASDHDHADDHNHGKSQEAADSHEHAVGQAPDHEPESRMDALSRKDEKRLKLQKYLKQSNHTAPAQNAPKKESTP
jgi:hypothetical protein